MLTMQDGLIVDNETTPPQCCGYLMDFAGRGVYSPDGKVEFTKEQADTHNATLAQSEILGLDQAEVGQYGTLYWSSTKGITTWTGVKVAVYTMSCKQTTLTFKRPNGHVFRGRIRKDAGCFNFRRVK